jgi:hypothetical protein
MPLPCQASIGWRHFNVIAITSPDRKFTGCRKQNIFYRWFGWLLTVENSIRPIALGKMHWLFAGSERAGQRAAVMQTLLSTAKLNGLDPSAWLKETLGKTPYLAQQPHRRIAAFR